MPYEPIDLGKIMQTAEAIKGARRQSVTDALQQQYLGGQIQSQAMAQQHNKAQIDAAQAKQHYLEADAILRSDDPHAAVQQFAPDLIQHFEQQHGQGSFASLAPDDVKKIAQMAKEKAGTIAGFEQVQNISGPNGSILARDSKGNIKQIVAPTKGPTSFDEYLLSQKDPEFAKFLKDRKGKGLKITNPDGSVIEIGGSGESNVGPADLSTPTKNKLQEAIVQSTDELDRLNSIGSQFDPQYLQIPGRIKGAALKVKDLAGGLLGDLQPAEKDYLDKFSSFKADAAKNLSTILNRLSGAAISPAEGERLKKGIPNDEDSPTQFIAKYRSAVKDSSRAIMRANWALKNGIGVKSVEQLSHQMPLGAIDHVYEQRANEIWQELGGTPETKAQAIKQANTEFGIAR